MCSCIAVAIVFVVSDVLTCQIPGMAIYSKSIVSKES